MSTETATNPVEGSELLSDTGVADQNLASDDTLSLENQDGETGDGEPELTDEDLEEIEHDGKKFKLPKALKPALMMNADYTKKTQELAETRRAFEETRAQLAQADTEHRKLLGAQAALDAQIEQYANVDWQAWRASNPEAARDARDRLQDLKDAKSEADSVVTKYEADRAAEAESIRTTRLQDAHAVLAKEIPDWDKPETKVKISTFAQAQGFTAQELSQVNDPRLIKLLHTAMTNAGKASQAAKVDQIAAGQKTQPANTVRGAGGKFTVGADTNDFAAFDKWADTKLVKKA